jgi:acetolactate synthase-1/2/3 large subunit
MAKKFIPDPKKMVVTTGVGQHQMWAAQHFKFEAERRWLTSGGLGSMGFGLPAAIGAAFALPHATVIDIDGDGSFQMNIQELAVAAIEKLNIKVVILNNQFLGMVFQWENTFYNKQHAHSFTGNPDTPDVPYPDFVAIAVSATI